MAAADGDSLADAWLAPTETASGEFRLHELRVLCWSDLHTDWQANFEHCDDMADGQDGDVLIVAGDVSDSLGQLEATLRVLRSKFVEVWFLPGNHDLWVKQHANEPFADSLEKFAAIEAMCARIGVHTRAARLETDGGQAVFVVPIQSWYCARWDTAPAPPPERQRRPGAAPLRASWMDFLHCRWPAALCPTREDQRAETPVLAEHFDALNDFEACLAQRRPGDVVISFSHYLPHECLLPGKEHLVHVDLPSVMGSAALREAVRRLRPDAHLFGHSHVPCDMVVEGTRFVQWPLGSPRERRRQGVGSWRPEPTPMVLLDTTRPPGRQWHRPWNFYWCRERLSSTGGGAGGGGGGGQEQAEEEVEEVHAPHVSPHVKDYGR